MGNLLNSVADCLRAENNVGQWMAGGWRTADPTESEPLLNYNNIIIRPPQPRSSELREDPALVAERLAYYRCRSLPELGMERRVLGASEVAALSERWDAAVAATEAKLAAGVYRPD